MVMGSNLSWQGIRRKAVYTKGAGPICKCTGSVHWKGVYRVGDRDLGVQNFFNWLVDQSETTKSHMFSTSFRLTNHK